MESVGIEPTELTLYREVGPLVTRARALVGQGCPVVAIGGGDGTLGAACSAFLGTPSAMMVLPAGTGNQFARDLGIPTGIEAAVQSLVEGKIQPVDVAQARGRYFVNVATIGLTTLIAESLQPAAKRIVGKLAYVSAVASALRRAVAFELDVATESEEVTLTTLQAVVGNGRLHGGPFPLSPTASLGSGRLSIYAVRAERKADMWRYATTIAFGGHVALPEVWWAEAARCTLVSRPAVSVTVDGELLDPAPLEAVSLPGALNVVVPRGEGCLDGVDWNP